MNIENLMQGFHFLRPWWLLMLPLLPLLLWYLHRIRLQSRSWQTVCDAALLPHLLIAEGGTRQRRGKLILVGLAGLLAITALAGPAWKQLEQPVFRDQSALVVILDLSRSMDATDVRPTRLTRARLKLIDILKQRREGQAALIVYAAEPFVVSPLTEDAETIIAQVGSLKTTMMPLQGSRSDLAVGLAQQLLVQAGAMQGELLLITDGVENVPQESLHEAVTAIVQAGYRLSILGVGDAEGAPIALADGGFLKDRSGAIVIPRLDEPALRALAQQGDGRYQAMSVDDRDISILLAETLLDREAVQEASQGFKADQWREEGPWLLLLILPLVLVVFRRGHLLMICLVVVPLLLLSSGNVAAAEAGQSWWSDLWSRPDQRAARAFERDEYTQAAQQFEDSEWKAAAHYRAADYQQSIAALEGIDSADALYNKGNAHAQLGQWQQALEAYEEALRLQPAHEDANYNRDLVKQQMQQQQPEETQSGEGQQSEQHSPQQGESPQESARQDESPSGQSGDERSGESRGSEPGSSLSEERHEEEQMPNSAQRDAGEAADAQREAARSGEAAEESSDEAQAAARGDESHEQGEEGKSQEHSAVAPAELSEAQAEIQQANDQWLRRIPDDPGGLLRRKFQYQSQRAKNRSGGQQRIEDESW